MIVDAETRRCAEMALHVLKSPDEVLGALEALLTHPEKVFSSSGLFLPLARGLVLLGAARLPVPFVVHDIDAVRGRLARGEAWN